MLAFRILLIGLVAAVLGYAIHGVFKYTRMIAAIFLSLVYKPNLEVLQSSVGEKISILDSSDHEIEALWIPRANASGLVIFCHESGANKDSWEKYAYFLPSLGFQLLSIDFHSANSQGESNDLKQWPAEEDVEQVLTAIRWAKRAHAPKKIILFGVSNGADIAFAASFREASVQAVIADGLFSMKEIFRDSIRKWAPMLVRPNIWGERLPEWLVHSFTNLGFWYSQKKSRKKFVDVESLLRKKHVPLLLIHGESDDYIPLSHQKLLHEIISGQKSVEHQIIPNAGHNEAVTVARRIYEDSIKDFLQTI